VQLRHYYHLYADGDYHEIVREHFGALRASGLLGRLDHLHIGVVGSAPKIQLALKRLKRLTSHKFVVSTAEFGWEQETQDYLYRDAVDAKTPFIALYAHTKGAANTTEINRVWRVLMTRHTTLHWKRAVAALTGDVGASGCFWAPFNNGRAVNSEREMQFFAGNFWWARSEAIAAIGRPDRNDRYDAERWIGKITKLAEPYRIACLFDAALDVDVLRRHEMQPAIDQIARKILSGSARS
jgi:hypothetical protein